MKIMKPHFWYNKSQRNGVFFLGLTLVALQVIYSFISYSNKEILIDDSRVEKLQAKIDSLKLIELEEKRTKMYSFNPNYITDYKGSQLGMSIDEIDRLIIYRKQNKFINSKEQFQKITQVSDSLLKVISPYFKFPDWVVKKNQKSKRKTKQGLNKNVSEKVSTNDINLATIKDFETIEGVEVFMAQRIVKYRNRLIGFSLESQLLEVWKLDAQTAKNILSVFKIATLPKIQKLNVNTATFKELLSNPYIDYDLCKKIFDFRDEVAELQSIEELKNIQGFPIDKYDRIVLYLEAK